VCKIVCFFALVHVAYSAVLADRTATQYDQLLA